MALVSKRKLIFMAVGILVTFGLYRILVQNSPSTKKVVTQTGTLQIEVTPESAYPLTIFDKNTGSEKTTISSKEDLLTDSTGEHTYIIKAYGFDDAELKVDIAEGATVNIKLALNLSNTIPNSSNVNIVTIDGTVVSQVFYYDYASWASGVNEDGNSVVLKNYEDAWETVYAGPLVKNSLLGAGIPENVISQMSGVQ